VLAHDETRPSTPHERDAPTLVFVHGWGCERGQFAHQVEGLRDRFRTISVDLPGHGESPPPSWENVTSPYYAEVLRESIRELDAEPVVLVGHSMGGIVAAHLATRWPESVSGVVFLDVPCEGIVDPGMRTYLEQFADRLSRGMIPDAERRAFAAMTVGPNCSAENRQRVEDSMSSVDPRLAALAMSEIVLLHDGSIVSEITCPTLAVFAARSLECSPMEVQLRENDVRFANLAGNLSIAHVGLIFDSGHFVMLDAPDQVNDLIVSFLGWHGLGS
jgi:pimeloyl-ACP methyl ester carboxylesterase